MVFGLFCRQCGVSLADKRNRQDRNCRLCHEKATLAFRCICGQVRLGATARRLHVECRRLLQLEKDDPILQCPPCLTDFMQSVANLMQQIQAADKITFGPSPSTPCQRSVRRRTSVMIKKRDVIADISSIIKSSILDQDIDSLMQFAQTQQHDKSQNPLDEAEEEYRILQAHHTISNGHGRLAKIRAAHHICPNKSNIHDLSGSMTSWLFTSEVDLLMEILVKPLSTVQVLTCQENMASVAKSMYSPRRVGHLPVVVPVIVSGNHFVLVIRSVDGYVVMIDSKSSGSEAAFERLNDALRVHLAKSKKSNLELSCVHHYLGQQYDHFSCGHWVVQVARLTAVVGLPVSGWAGYIVALQSKWSDVIRDHHEILTAHRLASFKEKSR
eukprot:GILJ01021211.1.p1 GENE.GILJ01021211.1~~GILJ01021211.1.p1  ORF type:complete len:384 (-),score=25.90 GILJ01021211.1:18-1169(-)